MVCSHETEGPEYALGRTNLRGGESPRNARFTGESYLPEGRSGGGRAKVIWGLP